MAAPRVPPKFDQGKFQQMTEPFTVRVERIKGNVKSLIPLPPKEGFAVGGPGWTSEEVQALEQWIVKDWSGGGTYLFQITDASSPPNSMEWTQVFNYPERNPPIFADAATPIPTPIQSAQGGFGGVGAYNGFGGAQPPWPPPAQQWQGMGAVPQAPAPAQSPWGFNPYMQPFSPFGQPSPWGFGYPGGFSPTQPNSTPVKPANEVDQLKVENERLRLAQLEERHVAQVRAQEEKHRQDMLSIQQEMAKLREATNAAKPAESDDVKQLRAELERSRADSARAEREAAEARHHAEMDALKQMINAKPAVDPEMAVMRARLEEQDRRREEERRLDDIRRDNEMKLQALREELSRMREPKGPDPVMMMVVDQMKASNESQKEIARLNSERDREIARTNADAIKDMKSQIVHPAEMFRMYREASSGQDQIIRSTVNTLTDVFGTAQKVFQSMMEQMGGQGESPAVRLIEGGMSQAKEIADRYFATKAQRETAVANAQKEMAKAQAAAYTAQWQPPPPVSQAAPAPAPTTAPVDGGLNGAQPMNGNGGGGHVQAAPVPSVVSKMRKGGKTDDEWFGQAMPDVQALRSAAAEFVMSLSINPPRLDDKGLPVGLGPDQVAMFVLQAANVIAQQKVPVLAFDKLFAEQMYPDLIDILLPDVPQGYREDVIKFMWKILKGEPLAPTSTTPNALPAQA